jgi:hypothetical protein
MRVVSLLICVVLNSCVQAELNEALKAAVRSVVQPGTGPLSQCQWEGIKHLLEEELGNDPNFINWQKGNPEFITTIGESKSLLKSELPNEDETGCKLLEESGDTKPLKKCVESVSKLCEEKSNTKCADLDPLSSEMPEFVDVSDRVFEKYLHRIDDKIVTLLKDFGISGVVTVGGSVNESCGYTTDH